MTTTTELTEMHCGECGITYAVPEYWRLEKQKNASVWYCPNGHSRAYIESDVVKLSRQLKEKEDQLQRERQRLDQVKAERDGEHRRVSAAHGQITKLRKRVGHGVCPCCNRRFPDLLAHIQESHPNFANTPPEQPASEQKMLPSPVETCPVTA